MRSVTTGLFLNATSLVLFFLLTFSTSGISVVKQAATFYQAEENNDITIKCNSQIKADMSHTKLVCFLQSKPVRILYELINGAESHDEQFAGRVRCDEDALREGRLRLHLSRVTTEDSGNYRCDLEANYDKITKRWTLKASEYFNISVTQTSHGENSDVPKASSVDEKQPLGGPKQGQCRSDSLARVGPVLAAVFLAALVFYGLYLVAKALRPVTTHDDVHNIKLKLNRMGLVLNHFSPV
ncbi:hypothetical protein PAMP_015992 [Pampus punctatissimus]